jgi:multidrug efflux system membrane fusion protein
MDLLLSPPAGVGARRGGDGLRRRRWLLGLSLLLPTLMLVLVAGCNDAPAPPPRKVPEVVVTTPVRGEVVDYQDFTGRLDGFRTVDIRARVSGYVTEAPFKEGDTVHEGDLLFLIDPRPYRAALNQAEAQVQLQEAQLKYQEALYQRNVRLKNSGQAVGMEELQQSQAQRDTTAAQLAAAHAAVENARLNLEWTKVTAPIGGRVSRRFVDPGNLVISETTAANTALTTLVSDQQLYAYFDVDERTYLDLVKPYQTGYGSSWLAKLHFPVLMSLANEGDSFEHMGTIDFIDNRVTATTGTIRMRGVFDNADGRLKAGLFGRFRLPLGKPYSTVLVSGEAVQSDQGHTYVYVVEDKVVDGKELKNVVAYRRVTLGQEVKGLRVVKDGLKEDERVILSGMQRVRPNDPVKATPQQPPKPPESPLVRLLAAHQADEGQKPAEKQTEPSDKGKKEPGTGHTES